MFDKRRQFALTDNGNPAQSRGYRSATHWKLMNEAQKTIMRYLNRSAGNANIPTDHTIRCFVGMIQTGEALMADFESTGGNYVIRRMQELCKTEEYQLRKQR